MRPFRFPVVALYLAGAALLATGHAVDDFATLPTSDVPVMSAVDEDGSVTAWAPPQKACRLQALPPGDPRPSNSSGDDDAGVRPAWGLLAAMLTSFLYLWTTIESGGVIPSLF